MLARSLLIAEVEKYKALCDATHAIFSCKNWDELEQKILSVALELADADLGTYYVRREEKTFFYQHIHRPHERSDKIVKDELPEIDTWGQQSLSTGKIIRVSSKTSILSSITGTLLSSSIYVPVKSESLEGIIQLSNTRENVEFTEEQEKLLSDFTQAVRVSLENLHLVNKLKESNEKLRSTQRLTAMLHLSDKPEDVINPILDTIIEVMGFDYAAVSLIDKTKGIISTRYGRSRDPNTISLGWIPKSSYSLEDKDIVPFTARENKPQIIDGWDERLNVEIYKEYGHEHLTRAYVPIPSRDRASSVGVIEAGFHKFLNGRRKRLETSDLELFAVHVGIVIENIRILEEAKQQSAWQARFKQWERLGHIAQRMFSELPDVRPVLQTIADATRELLNAHSVFVLPISNRGNIIKDWISVSPKEFMVDYRAGDPKREGAVHRVFQQGLVEVLDVSNLELYPFAVSAKFSDAFDIHSYTAIRLQIGEDKLGAIFINFGTKRRLNSEEKELLQHIADLSEGAIRNANLIESERSWSNNLSKLVNLSKTITKELDLEQNLGRILHEISEILPNDQSVIWLVEESTNHEEQGSIQLKPRMALGRNANKIKSMKLKIGQGIVGKVAETKKPVLTQNAAFFPGAEHVPDTDKDIEQAMIAVPLIFKEELLGVITISRYGLGEFDTFYDKVLMELIGDIAASSIKTSSLLTELQIKNEQLTHQQEILNSEFDSAFEDRGERYAGIVFYDTVAHDIKNVLNIIKAELSKLQENNRFMRSLSKSDRINFGNAIQRIENSQETVDEFLDLALKPPTGNKADPHHLIKRALRLMKPRLDNNHVEVYEKISEDLPSVKVNIFRILEVILNLLSNAIKAMESKPINRRELTIKASLTSDGKSVQIVVSDTGIGIKREHIQSIFTRGHSWWPGRETSGSGIGLHVSKTIVEQEGGSLYLADTKYGYGSTFIINLPVTKEVIL